MQPTDHSFRYNQNAPDVKYSRTDAQDGQSSHGSVQSTQAPVTQTPNQFFTNQFPPYFLYTGMMAQSLYQTPASVPFLPVQPNPASAGNQPHANSNHSSGFPPKGAQNQSAYSASAYSSAGYDPSLGQLPGQDYGKQNYSGGPNNSQQAQQKGNQMTSGGSNDLTNSNMYTKPHAQLTKVCLNF